MNRVDTFVAAVSSGNNVIMPENGAPHAGNGFSGQPSVS